MTYENAKFILAMQHNALKKIRDVRFIHKNYEYRIDYRGGFASYIAIDRREVGKRNFKFFGGVGAYNCMSADDAMKLVYKEIIGKVGE